MPSRVTVWYDSSCPLCIREIALMRRLDRRGAIQFIDVLDPQGVCPLDRAELLSRFHAEEEGRLFSGAEAFAAMWRAIPILRPLGLLAGWQPRYSPRESCGKCRDARPALLRSSSSP